MSRKDRDRIVRDLGGDEELAAADAAEAENTAAGTDRIQQKTSVVLLDRILLRIVRRTTDRLKGDRDETARFFRHYFGASLEAEELEEWVDHFMSSPPRVSLGYPQSDAELPGIFVILESSSTTQTFVGDHGGETLGDEPGEESEFLAEFKKTTLGLYCYALHPSVCSYLYHYVDMIVLGAAEALAAAGVMDRVVSGGELSPEEAYLPQNAHLRVVRFEGTTVASVPQLKPYLSASRLSVGGIYVCDVVVDGMRGGVHPTTTPDEEG